jgi:RNA polymerase sigma-70 factor, ECF subfamily
VTTSQQPGFSEPAVCAGFAGSDAETWLTALDSGGRARTEAVRHLRMILVAAARFEASRRCRDIPDLCDEELDDIVSEAAEHALNCVLNSLQEYAGERRFTTWARKFAVVEASVRLRRRAWQSRTLPSEGECWASAAEGGDHQALRLLRRATEEALGDTERRVLTAVTLGNVPIDVIADRLGTTRGAVNQMVQGARARVSASLVAWEKPLSLLGGNYRPGGSGTESSPRVKAERARSR